MTYPDDATSFSEADTALCLPKPGDVCRGEIVTAENSGNRGYGPDGQPIIFHFITQAELEEIRELTEAERIHKEKRRSLIRRLQNGATVENGRLGASVQHRVESRLSAKSLMPLLGAEQIDVLKGCLEPLEYDKLIVEDRVV